MTRDESHCAGFHRIYVCTSVPGENALRERSAGTRTDARAPTDLEAHKDVVRYKNASTPHAGAAAQLARAPRDERPPKALPAPLTAPHFDVTLKPYRHVAHVGGQAP